MDGVVPEGCSSVSCCDLNGFIAAGCYTSQCELSMFFVALDEKVSVARLSKSEMELPLLCSATASSKDMIIVCGGGLHSTEILFGVFHCPGTADAGLKRQKTSSVEDYFGDRLKPAKVCIPDKGGVNCMTISVLSDKTFALFYGCQNGDLMRMSLVIRDDLTVHVVNAASVVHSHKMDVRDISFRQNWICSCSDDGSVILSSLAGSVTMDPIFVSNVELLCCDFVSDDAQKLILGSKDRKIVKLDLGNEKKKVKEPIWTAKPIRHVPRNLICKGEDILYSTTKHGCFAIRNNIEEEHQIVGTIGVALSITQSGAIVCGRKLMKGFV